LYRTKSGRGMVARPGHSGHEFGEAIDWTKAPRVSGCALMRGATGSKACAAIHRTAPRGTRVSAEGEGLFKQTEVTRNTQMEPASQSAMEE
jgi:hypothetical protein